MSRRHGIVPLIMVGIVMWLAGIAGGVALAPSSTPYATTTLYGKGPTPIGIADEANGDTICNPTTATGVQIDPNTRGIRSVDDEGQTVSVIAWPNAQREIVLELTRAEGSGSVWSYRALIARDGTGIIGIGGLDPIGVVSQKIQIVITVGTDRPIPTNLTLCRSTEGVG